MCSELAPSNLQNPKRRAAAARNLSHAPRIPARRGRRARPGRVGRLALRAGARWTCWPGARPGESRGAVGRGAGRADRQPERDRLRPARRARREDGGDHHACPGGSPPARRATDDRRRGRRPAARDRRPGGGQTLRHRRGRGVPGRERRLRERSRLLGDRQRLRARRQGTLSGAGRRPPTRRRQGQPESRAGRVEGRAERRARARQPDGTPGRPAHRPLLVRRRPSQRRLPDAAPRRRRGAHRDVRLLGRRNRRGLPGGDGSPRQGGGDRLVHHLVQDADARQRPAGRRADAAARHRVGPRLRRLGRAGGAAAGRHRRFRNRLLPDCRRQGHLRRGEALLRPVRRDRRRTA